MIFNPMKFMKVTFTIVGGLILIALMRLALRKWKKTYMPPSDGKTMTIFGITIPGWSQMKALAIGIKNFITIGLPNWKDRLLTFFGGIRKKLFGKKGIFRNFTQAKSTLTRLLLAYAIGATKKVGGMLMTILGYALLVIPGAGPFAKFLIEFGPAVYSFVATQIMLIWSKAKA